ncbi:MAG: FAD-dependent oxidoreductase [Phycisphaerae bacterium]|nr:FAD-dependent oxidoreductase [Phycisphaerae bacterium]MBC03198.1 FAD-dependent oxidoreductase [Phycisphaerae bacterium]
MFHGTFLVWDGGESGLGTSQPDHEDTAPRTSSRRYRPEVSEASEQPVDLLVLGAGIAGLWILDAATRAGLRAVGVECAAIGRGQSVSAQGIIHGGLKYTLRERDVAAAGSIRDMPAEWLRMNREPDSEGPDLSRAVVSSPCTWIWRTERLASRIGMLGARAALRSRPEAVKRTDRPVILQSVPGQVLRVDEPVFETRTVLQAIAEPLQDRLVGVSGPEGIEISSRSGLVDTVTLRDGSGEVCLRPEAVVLAAGTGNEGLLSRLGLDAGIAQRRPLHMTLLRSPDLPRLHGHCVDGNRTRITVTSAHDSEGRVVWQLGGELAESGVDRDPATQLAHAAGEIEAVLPALDPASLRNLEWATYRVDRAERRTGQGLRPDDATIESHHDGRLIAAWPTKWALAPRLAARVLEAIPCRAASGTPAPPDLRPLLAPEIAPYPWEEATWTSHQDVRSAGPA